MKTQTRYYALSSVHPQLPRVARTISPQEVVLLDWEQQSELGRFRGKVGTVKAIALHPEGALVAVAGEEDQVEVWDALAKEKRAEFTASVSGLRFSPDGKTLLLGQPGRLSAWEWQTNSVRWQSEQSSFLNPAILDCHQNSVLWSAMGSGALVVLDLASGEVRHGWDTQDEFMAVAFHPDGKRIAAAINAVRSPLLHMFVMLRAGADLPEKEFPIPFSSVSIAVSPGGGTIATGDGRGVQLWDFASGAPEGRLAPRVEARVKDLGTVEMASAFLVSQIRWLDSKQLVSDGDRFCRWNVSGGEPLWSYPA